MQHSTTLKQLGSSIKGGRGLMAIGTGWVQKISWNCSYAILCMTGEWRIQILYFEASAVRINPIQHRYWMDYSFHLCYERTNPESTSWIWKFSGEQEEILRGSLACNPMQIILQSENTTLLFWSFLLYSMFDISVWCKNFYVMARSIVYIFCSLDNAIFINLKILFMHVFFVCQVEEVVMLNEVLSGYCFV